MDELAVGLVRLGVFFAIWVAGIWVAAGLVAAWAALEKGREPVAWFVLAFFLSPIVALIALCAVPSRPVAQVGSGRRPGASARPVLADAAAGGTVRLVDVGTDHKLGA